MKLLAISISALLMSTPALAAQSCEELKTAIDTKIAGKGVKGYTLEIVAQDQAVTTGKVVGTCGGGKQKIVYTRK